MAESTWRPPGSIDSSTLVSHAVDNALYSDCDSEGNDPPKTTDYVDPNSIDERGIPPPRGNEPIRLPFFKPRERGRLREDFESKVGFEDWVEETGDDIAGKRSKRSGVIKLEDDSDFPIGRNYFWHAYCPSCPKSYYPHIPGQWTCLQCQERVWQSPKDPESKRCAVCARDVAPIVIVKGKKVRNPMKLNAHFCKRCGRVVCDRCYAPHEQALPELGYEAPQRICTRCVNDIRHLVKPPSEEDLGTLYEDEEVVNNTVDQGLCNLFWTPKCNRCNITFGVPPKKWICTSCAAPVWQPADGPDSANCWICNAQHPHNRCHQCGQLVCPTCGAYGQPLPQMGYDQGLLLSVCKACYQGVSNLKKVSNPDAVEVGEQSVTFRAQCQKCKQALGAPPDQWVTKCCRQKAWQIAGPEGAKTCTICMSAIAGSTADNCRRCGNAVCLPCAQYKEPVPERGFPKTEGQIICRRCFNPALAFVADTSDFPFWPPACMKCNRQYPTPPDRWRCPFQCGPVWQPLEHIASKACWVCGKKLTSSPINCRKCGRLVCHGCGEGRAEVTEWGFTRGMSFPVCLSCYPKQTVTGTDSASEKSAKK